MLKLLEILSSGKWLSYEQLVSSSSYDQTSLAEQIQSLKMQGLHIEQRDNQIRLIPELDLLNINYLSQSLPEHQLIIQSVIPSTNQYLLDNITNLEKGSLCLAEYQSAGRGRRGRQWHSPFAGQIIMSLYWTFDRKTDLNGLSLVVGVAIVEALKQMQAQDIHLKWPNDILLQGRKLAGILLEVANKPNGLHNIVIGIGVNLSLGKQGKQIDQPWAELCEILPHLDRNQLLVNMVKSLRQHLTQFEQQGIDVAFQQKWASLDQFMNTEVQIISENHIVRGIAQGIDQRGYLRLLTEQGVQYFNGGEVSLRRIENN